MSTKNWVETASIFSVVMIVIIVVVVILLIAAVLQINSTFSTLTESYNALSLRVSDLKEKIDGISISSLLLKIKKAEKKPSPDGVSHDSVDLSQNNAYVVPSDFSSNISLTPVLSPTQNDEGKQLIVNNNSKTSTVAVGDAGNVLPRTTGTFYVLGGKLKRLQSSIV